MLDGGWRPFPNLRAALMWRRSRGAEVNIANPLAFQEKQVHTAGYDGSSGGRVQVSLGREISQEDILYIRALIERHPNESRRTLSTKLCVKRGSERQTNGIGRAAWCAVACC